MIFLIYAWEVFFFFFFIVREADALCSLALVVMMHEDAMQPRPSLCILTDLVERTVPGGSRAPCGCLGYGGTAGFVGGIICNTLWKIHISISSWLQWRMDFLCSFSGSILR